MSWSSNRQLKYLSLVLIFLLGVFFLLFKPLIFPAPTCMDGRRNGNEAGIDCGGECARYCTELAEPLSVIWSRAFRVTEGRYNVAAYIENHNTDAGLDSIKYTFKIYDASNRFIVERSGETFIPAGGPTVIFEPALITGPERVPSFVRFEFTETPTWWTVWPEAKALSLVVTKDPELLDTDTIPKLSAEIVNRSFYRARDVEVDAILYDKDGTALALSETRIAEINPNSSALAYFSWYEPIVGEIGKKEIITRVNPFAAAP